MDWSAADAVLPKPSKLIYRKLGFMFDEKKIYFLNMSSRCRAPDRRTGAEGRRMASPFPVGHYRDG